MYKGGGPFRPTLRSLVGFGFRVRHFLSGASCVIHSAKSFIVLNKF